MSLMAQRFLAFLIFFFNDTATTEICALSLPVAVPIYAGHLALVSLEGKEFLALVGVPHLRRAVQAAGEEPPDVRAARHADHLTRVSLEGEELLARVGVPHLRRTVLEPQRTATDAAPAV